MKVAVLLTAITGWLLLGACSNGDKSAPPEGQSDYFDRIVDVVCNAGAADATGSATPDLKTTVDRMGAQADGLSKLQAPPDIKDAQQRLVAALRSAQQALHGLPDGATLQPDSTAAQKLQEVQDRNNDWAHAFEAHYAVRFFRNEGASMDPTFHSAEAVAARTYGAPIERWQIAVFRFPLDPSRNFIKRVVAVPGETIEVRSGDGIYVNGTKLADDEYHLDEVANYNYGPKTVPADSYFVLGDNRRNSYDSHAWGSGCSAQPQCDFVPAANILGVLDADAKGCASGASP